jgi:tetratricopeptide (TPR) repeat protein
MSRFGQLEFDESSDKRRAPAQQKAGGEPQRDEKYFHDTAVICWLAGDFELALRNYSRSLEVRSTFLEGWAGQVRMLIELGEYAEAMMWADKAMVLFPEHPDLLAGKAVAAARDGKWAEAMAWSDTAITQPNAGARVWISRAEVLMLRNNAIADTCIGNAMGMAGYLKPIIHLEGGRLLSRTRNYFAAIEHLNLAVRLLPKSALAWYELGNCQAALGRSEAQVTLEQCLKLRPDWPAALECLHRRRGFVGAWLARIFRR